MIDTNPLRASLEALRAEASSLEASMDSWRRELEAAEQRLIHVRGAVQNLQFILGDLPVSKPVVTVSGKQVWPNLEDSNTESSATALELSARGVDSEEESATGTDATKLGEVGEEPTRPAARIKRTRSTEWIAEIINNTGRVMTRDEVYEEYERQKGIPESWNSPRNSLGNALGRAVTNKWVKRLPGDLYVGVDVDLFAKPSAEEGNDG